MTKTERENQLLLAIYKETNGDPFGDPIKKIGGQWKGGVFKEDYKSIIKKFYKYDLIDITEESSLIGLETTFINVVLTEKGVEKCKELMEEKKITKTEKANQILLWVYKDTKGDIYDFIPEINNHWRDGVFKDDYDDLLIMLEDHGFIKIKEKSILKNYASVFKKIGITEKGIEKCEKLIEESKRTKVEKANQILLWIYEKIGDDEYDEIPKLTQKNCSDLGFDYKEFFGLLEKLKNKGLVEMEDNKPRKNQPKEFYNVRFTQQGREKSKELKENDMIKFNLPKSNVRLTSNPNVRINNPFKKQKPSANKKVEKTENKKDDIIVTYCWDNEPHKQKVLEFVYHLRKEEGFNATFDRRLNQEKTAIDFPKMMHLAMTDYRKVIIVLSKGYKEKAEKFTGGVGNEFQLIIKDIEANQKKYILVSFEGISDEITPLAFKGRHTVDLSNNDETAWNELRSKLRDEPIIDLPPVAKTQKPIIKQKIDKFKPIKNDISQEDKLVRNLNLRKEIEKDFGDFLSYRSEDNNVTEILLRAFDGKQYPKTNKPDKHGNYEWYKVEMLRLYHQGVEFINGIKEIQVYQDGSWESIGIDSEITGKKVTVFEIGQINFQDIIDYNKNGDEFYIYPHFFCKFRYDGSPFENIYYLDVKEKYQIFEMENKK